MANNLGHLANDLWIHQILLDTYGHSCESMLTLCMICTYTVIWSRPKYWSNDESFYYCFPL